MKVKYMRLVDKYAGYAACALFTALGPGGPARVEKEKIKRILTIKFWGIGSILLLTPAIKGLREEFSGARIVFFTALRNREICEALGIFDEVFYLDLDGGWFRFASSLAKNLFRVISGKFDMVMDFEFFTRFSAVISFFSFAKVRAGYHAWEAWRGDIHNIKVPFNRYWHIMDNFYNLGVCAGLEPRTELKMAKPAVTAGDRAAVEELLARAGVSGGFVAANVNASNLVIERRWPHENFVELSRRLIKKHGRSIIFVGSGSERGAVDAIVQKIGDPLAVNLAGRLNISRLACLFEKADLVISNDSGPLHLAVAMETPTVSLFGPETPAIYGPRGKAHIVIFKNIDCSPCINVHDRKSVQCYWEKPKCMASISVEEVLEAVDKALAGAG